MKPEFSTFDFPADLLKRAEQITLKDLLDTPFSQAWIVSAISNAQHYATEYPVEKNDDRLLFELFSLVRKLPRNERQTLFQQTTYLLKKNREERDREDRRSQNFKGGTTLTKGQFLKLKPQIK